MGWTDNEVDVNEEIKFILVFSIFLAMAGMVLGFVYLFMKIMLMICM